MAQPGQPWGHHLQGHLPAELVAACVGRGYLKGRAVQPGVLLGGWLSGVAGIATWQLCCDGASRAKAYLSGHGAQFRELCSSL